MIKKGKHVSAVSLNSPYFVSLNHCEGELRVGLAVPRFADPKDAESFK
jgi:hypothetical protein